MDFSIQVTGLARPGRQLRVAVLGAGSWGTALAALLSANGHSVRLWARDAHLAAALNAVRENLRYLPGVVLSESVLSTSVMEQAVADAHVVVFAIPSGGLRSVAEQASRFLAPDALIISASKGLEEGSGLRMSQVLAEVIPAAQKRIVALTGPNLAVEVARGAPTASVAASESSDAARMTQVLFLGQEAPTFRVYVGRDVVGVELGGAVKNVIAIGAGVCDGLGFGDNSKAALMTRGLSEAVRLGVAEGAGAATFMGLSGVGDLIATGGSKLSRNYRVGFALGQGRTLATALAEIGQVAEGVPTTRVLCELAVRNRIEMPLCQALYAVLFDNRPAAAVIRELMVRPPKEEHPC